MPEMSWVFQSSCIQRIEMIADEGSFEEWDMDLDGMDGPPDPLQFKGYSEKIKKLREQTGLKEAVVTGRVKINGRQAVIGVCDGRFMMASMGYAVGEKITRAVERATNEKLPVILFTCSGGARMQEGIISLMQMAKTSAALKRHSDAGLLYSDGTDRSDDRRSDSQFCHAGGYYNSRTTGIDWVCRPTGDRADDWRETAGRIFNGQNFFWNMDL